MTISQDAEKIFLKKRIISPTNVKDVIKYLRTHTAVEGCFWRVNCPFKTNQPQRCKVPALLGPLIQKQRQKHTSCHDGVVRE